MWSIFAPLLRTLTGGRSTFAPKARANTLSFEAEWAWLIAQLKLPPQTLRDVFVSGSLEPHFSYQRYFKPKQSGGKREIAEPDSRLKHLQHEIISRHFTTGLIHSATVAYQKGMSTADHVWAHAGAEVIVLADIQDFFPNTRVDRVETWWRSRVNTDTARLLTILTTDRGGLPQGAPTSPALSNLVNFELDTRLEQRATLAGASYTRYCDDLAFSWPRGAGPPSGFEPTVRAVLHEFGYALHPTRQEGVAGGTRGGFPLTKGWRIYDRLDEPEVTGAILTSSGGVRLPERLRLVMRELARSSDPRDLERLKGYMGYAAMLTSRAARRKARKKKAQSKSVGPVVDPSIVVPAVIAPAPVLFNDEPDPYDEFGYDEFGDEPDANEPIPF
ncbi:MAG: reverse transcriptase family protein [Planctomycetia bacterium]|nr:reverse transcriptase family protein [Planctomycetia bacterium]